MSYIQLMAASLALAIFCTALCCAQDKPEPQASEFASKLTALEKRYPEFTDWESYAAKVAPDNGWVELDKLAKTWSGTKNQEEPPYWCNIIGSAFDPESNYYSDEDQRDLRTALSGTASLAKSLGELKNYAVFLPQSVDDIADVNFVSVLDLFFCLQNRLLIFVKLGFEPEAFTAELDALLRVAARTNLGVSARGMMIASTIRARTVMVTIRIAQESALRERTMKLLSSSKIAKIEPAKVELDTLFAATMAASRLWLDRHDKGQHSVDLDTIERNTFAVHFLHQSVADDFDGFASPQGARRLVAICDSARKELAQGVLATFLPMVRRMALSELADRVVDIRLQMKQYEATAGKLPGEDDLDEIRASQPGLKVVAKDASLAIEVTIDHPLREVLPERSLPSPEIKPWPKQD